MTGEKLTESQQQIDAMLCRLLKGESLSWPYGDSNQAQIALFLERSSVHGVQAAIWTSLQPGSWPQVILEHLHKASLEAASWELAHRHALGQVLSGFAAENIGYMLFKGTALAYSFYANPVLRFRCDTDMLVSGHSKTKAEKLLEGMGFECSSAAEELVYYQQSWRLNSSHCGTHAIDLHWKLNNSEVLANLFSYEELRARGNEVTICGVKTFVPCKVDAVLIACLHSAGHEGIPYLVNGKTYLGGSRLVWLYDLHLLISHFSLQDWHDLTERAVQKGLGNTCAVILDRVREKFGTVMFLEGLEILASDKDGKATVYLDSGPIMRMWLDITACRSWKAKLTFVRQLFFPSEAYMRNKYASGSQWLFVLYIRRSIEGLYRRLHAN